MGSSSKPQVAIISNSQTPYRLQLHLRIVNELPEIDLWSLFTHDVSNAPWMIEPRPETRPVFFGSGERSEDQSKLSSQHKEWRKAGEILAWIKEHDIRCVVLLGYNDLGRVRILRACRAQGLPCFLFGDSNILADRMTGWKAALKRIIVGSLVRSATGIFYCGNLGKAYFEKYGASPKSMFPFPYEPDYAAFDDVGPDEIAGVRKTYGLEKDRHYVIYSGRLVREKRVDLLLKAFAEIAADRPDWDLIVAGDGALKEELRRDLPEALSTRILWTGFINSPKQLAAIYRCAEVLVLPSEFEPWGVVVTEAATSLALICSSVVGAAADVLHDGVNGRFFKSGDSESLKQALLDVTDPRNLARMRAASRPILTEWRKVSDPIRNLRRSLEFANVV